MPSSSQQLQFRPRARIIRTIGDQLISGPEAAVIELVKNSYDADATFVTIQFMPPLRTNFGRIVITDDGHGMTRSDIEEKWMEPATSSKLEFRRSPIRKRPMMGSKGIGRFAAAKLGRFMALISVSDRTGERTEVLIPQLDWDSFNADTYLSEISIDFLSQETTKATGTTIEISSLSEDWTQGRISELFRELRRLISPLQKKGDDDFSIYLDLSACTPASTGWDPEVVLGAKYDTTEFKSADRPVRGFKVEPFPILSSSDYEVSGYFDPAGQFHGTIQIHRGGQSPKPIELSVALREDEEACGNVEVRLYIFDREANVVRAAIRRAGLGDVSTAEARQILDSIVGVAIYRDGFRIRPYGDTANDWLTLDKRRVQFPTKRIGHNQIAGYVSVQTQEISGLIEKSSREGFEQNAAYRRLERLIISLLAERVEPSREDFRDKAGIARKKQTSFEEIRQISELVPLQRLMKEIPEATRENAKNILAKQSALMVEKIEALEERQRILEAQSSLGQIIGEILHEGAPSAAFIARTGKWLKDHYRFLFDNSKDTEEAQREYPSKLALIQDSGEKLRNLFSVLRPLSGTKRAPPEDFYGPDTAHEVIGLFKSHNFSFTVEDKGAQRRLYGYKEDLKTALVNLVGNSVFWLEHSKASNPHVHISFEWKHQSVSIFVDDNGPGIPEDFADQIFEVGFTLKEGGTGLGLNIAKEALARSDATLHYHMEYPGGSRFEIRFPCVR